MFDIRDTVRIVTDRFPQYITQVAVRVTTFKGLAGVVIKTTSNAFNHHTHYFNVVPTGCRPTGTPSAGLDPAPQLFHRKVKSEALTCILLKRNLTQSLC